MTDGTVNALQVVNLHYMLSKTLVKARPSVLWCYKKDLYLSRCVVDGEGWGIRCVVRVAVQCGGSY